MTTQYDLTYRSTTMSDLVSRLGTTPYLLLYTGAQPANCAASATGTLLASLPGSNPAGTVASGELTFSAFTTENATASGTAGYYRLCTSAAGTTCIQQGSCGLSGSGADLILDNTSIASGQPFSVTSWTITAYGA